MERIQVHRNCFRIGEWLVVWLRLGAFMERYGLEKEFCGCTLRYPNLIGEHLIYLPAVHCVSKVQKWILYAQVSYLI